RQPTTDGPPAELQDNSTRKSTYPALVVNAEMDALMATLTLDKWTGLKNSSFRIGYSKAFQDIASVFTEFDLDDTRAIPLIFETQIPGFDNSLFMFAYARVMDLPSIRQFPDFMVRKQVKSVGDLDLLSGHIQLNNVRNSGIDCFFSWAHSHADTSSRGTRLVSGQEIGLFGDNLGGGLGKDRWGYAVYTGFRYTLPWDSLKNPKIGFEYNYGSKYWLGLFTGGSDDPMHKLMVNGNAIDFYYIQPLHIKHTFMRFGYTRANYDYSPDFGPYGARESVDRIMRSFYCLLDIRF
ncbi:MAG: DUF3373 family protein, partial [Thermodesulfobacteriota bacterium]|nr:DUF3373 family protein [Thermodesulfobacteriota bacterium]